MKVYLYEDYLRFDVVFLMADWSGLGFIRVLGTVLQDSGELWREALKSLGFSFFRWLYSGVLLTHVVEESALNWSLLVHVVNLLVGETVAHSCQQVTKVVLVKRA